MKTFKAILTTGAVGIGLLAGRSLFASETLPPRPPVVVPPNRGDRDMLRDLRAAPSEVKKLVNGFDSTRDRYLVQQRELLRQLKGATAEERERVRQQLQDNREKFLAEVKEFRQSLRKDLQELKGKISHQEMRRILEAAKDAATDGRVGHKGRK